MLRRIALAGLATLLSSTTAAGAQQQTISTVGAPVVEEATSYGPSDLVLQTFLAPSRARALTSFWFFYDSAIGGELGVYPWTPVGWLYHAFVYEVGYEGGLAMIEYSTRLFESDAVMPEVGVPGWAGFEGEDIRVTPGVLYAAGITFHRVDDPSADVLLNYPRVTPDAYPFGGSHWGGENLENLNYDLVFEATFTSVPEPSTWLMLATGLLIVWFAGWRRRRALVPARAVALALVIGSATPSLALSQEIHFHQGDGVHPVRTWCLDPTMGFCFAANLWDFDTYSDPVENLYTYGLQGQWFGSGFTLDWMYYEPFTRFGVYFDAPCEYGDAGFNRDFDGMSNDVFWGYDPVPDGYVGVGNPTGTGDCRVPRATTLDDFTQVSMSYYDVATGARTVVGSCSPYDGTCFTPIPEPQSCLLLGTGLLCLGWLAKRRKVSDGRRSQGRLQTDGRRRQPTSASRTNPVASNG